MSFKDGVLCFVLLAVVLFLGVKSEDALTHPLKLTLEKGAAIAPIPGVPPFTPMPLTPPPGLGKPAPLTSGALTQSPLTGEK